MHKYLVLIWRPDDSASTIKVGAVERSFLAIPSWAVAYKDGGIVVMHNPTHPQRTDVHLLSDRSGVILGSLFRRSRAPQVADSAVRHFSPSETAHIKRTFGRDLVNNYWGSYVAIVRDVGAASSSVLRDPTANLACYHTKWGNVQVFFSDLEDFVQHVNASFRINWSHIAARLRAGMHLSRDCGLSGVEDVPGGECITFSEHGETRLQLWHPAQFCIKECLEDDWTAAQELRASVLNTVQTLASQHSSILIRLSGGLDSSIVTSCIAQMQDRPRVTCLNYYTSPVGDENTYNLLAPSLNQENRAKLRRIVGSADEREFARSVSRRCGFRIVERERCSADIDFEQIWTAPLTPRPSNQLLLLTEDHAELDCAAATNATACFTGEAGDTVFYCTLRAIGAIDYACLHPFGSRLAHYIGETSALSGESVARVVGKVLKYGLLGLNLPPPYDPLKQPHLLKEEAAAAIPSSYFRHPWEDGVHNLCPGKRNHVVGVANSALFYSYVQHRDRTTPSVRPLASQPVVEACMRIPSYVLLAGGVSRGLARRAFRDLLPPEVVRRTVKGLTAAFWQTVVRRNVQIIRECLLDGMLVREGLLDRRKLEDYLVDEQTYFTVGAVRIMDLVQCEAWVTQCSANFKFRNPAYRDLTPPVGTQNVG